MTSVSLRPIASTRVASSSVTGEPKKQSPIQKIEPFNLSAPGTEYRIDRALSMAEFSAIAYDTPTNIEAKLARSGFKLESFYSASGIAKHGLVDSQCFVASNDKAVVLSFRGSESLTDFVTDAAAVFRRRVNFGDESGLVHRGFANAVEALTGVGVDPEGRPITVEKTPGSKASSANAKLGLYEEIAKLVQGPPARKLFINGHSLGGAMATISALQLAKRGVLPEAVYTIGSPRAGGTEYAQAYDSLLKDRTFRQVNYSDMVTRLPFAKEALQGGPGFNWSQTDASLFKKVTGIDTEPGRYEASQYRHVGTLKYINKDGEISPTPPGTLEQTRDYFRSAGKGEFETVLNHLSADYVGVFAKLAAKPGQQPVFVQPPQDSFITKAKKQLMSLF